MPTVNGDLEVKGNLNALRSISVVGNTVGNISAGPGSLVLAGGSNVTLSGSTAPNAMTLSVGMNNNTIANLNNWQNFPFIVADDLMTMRSSMVIEPFLLTHNLTYNQIRLLKHVDNLGGATSSFSHTYYLGLYSYNNSTQLTLMGSFSNEFVGDINSYTTNNLWAFTGVPSGISSLSPGPYVFAITRAAVIDLNSHEVRLMGGHFPNINGYVYPGTDSAVTASSVLSSSPWVYPFHGRYSATTNGIPSSINFNDVVHHSGAAAHIARVAWINLGSF